MVQPLTAGDPMTSAKWLNCRLRDLQARLLEKAHTVSLPVISRLLRDQDYRLRSNDKSDEGHSPSERDRQFLYLHQVRQEYRQARQPILSVDTKKKELVGNFKNAGQ